MSIGKNQQIRSTKMKERYYFTDVSVEAVMNATKVVSSAAIPLSMENIAKALETQYKATTVKQILNMCTQLGVLEKDTYSYIASSKYKDRVKQANKDQLNILFREALQNYPPFLLYADFINNGYSPDDSASMVRGIMQISSGQKTVEKVLRVWGISTKLIVNEDGKFRIPETKKGLTTDYVKGLLKALDNELNAKMFLVNILSSEIYNYIDSLGMDITDLAKAIMSYETDPKEALRKSTSFFEMFLHKFGTDVGVSVQGKNGVNALVNEFFNSVKILKNQQHLGNGLGGARNISMHGVDKNTGKEWHVTPQAALSNIFFVLLIIRSFYLYVKKNEQVF